MYLVLSHNPLYPGHHLRDPGVHPGVLRLSAANAPGHNANLFTSPVVRAIKKWSTGVTLDKKEVIKLELPDKEKSEKELVVATHAARVSV